MSDATSDRRFLSRRLMLREFVDTDEASVHAYASDPIVTTFMEWGPNSVEDTRAFLRAAIDHAASPVRADYDLAITDVRSGAVLGGAALSVTNTEHRRGEIGYVLHRDHWSQGLATETAVMLLRFGFDELGLRRISATCHPENRASARVLQKAGLVFEGRMRSHMLVRGHWRDSLLYAIVRDDLLSDR
ncbi:MAG: GNAT family protein [Mycobacterium kyogaense]|jgi:[ribosomal protein S5]-alanine N-acetyltransferase|uniref:GNAT family N-acetyltransferase n=1 Tax=Mycobacterium kyogaense TaxID=2212479 RepID=UPI002FF9B545